jgi:hypothetical protein
MIISAFSLPHEAVPLEQAVDDAPEMEAKAQRMASHSGAWVMPRLWAGTTDFDVASIAGVGSK